MECSLRKAATMIALTLCATSMTPGSASPAGAQQLSAPDAPMIGASIAGDGQAIVSWAAPVSDGGSPVTLYVVTPYVGYYPLPSVTFASPTTTPTVTGLTNGTTYRFRVQAVNALGTSALSGVSNAVTPGPVEAGGLWHADADTDVDLGNATLYWQKEVASGDETRLSIVEDPVGLYGKVYRAALSAGDIDAGDNRAEFAQALLGDGSTKLKLANDLTATGATREIWFGWRSLFGGDLAVSSRSSNDGNFMQLKGDSSCGGPAIGMTVKYGRLTLRSERYLTATDGIAWNGPPMSTMLDGNWHGFLLHVKFAKDDTGYLEVTLDGVPQVMTNGANRIHFPTVCPGDSLVYPKLGVYGMDRGTGAGPVHWIESPRIGLTPASAVPAPAVPGAPTIGAAVAGDGQATVSWTAPASDGGAAITGYVVTPYVGYSPLEPRWFGPGATTRTIAGLADGTSYRFRVQAVNAVGAGDYSKATNPVTPAS